MFINPDLKGQLQGTTVAPKAFSYAAPSGSVPHAELTAPSQPETIAALSQMIAVPEYPVSALSDGLAKYYFRILRIGENPWALRQVDTPFFRAVPSWR